MKKYAVITMDVEDWYHTYFPEMDVDKSQTLLDGLDVALGIMKKKNVKGSFFVVGEIADMLGEKLREMDRAGHDIACHNWTHLRPNTMPLKKYKEQLIRSKMKIEEILGHEIFGYRAPSFGMDDARLEAVIECGFKYDSSRIKPQKSAKYGLLTLPGFQEVFPCIFKRNDFTEFEASTQRIGRLNMLLGGGYLRMLPWPFMKWMTEMYLKSGKPYVLYIHPIDLSRKPIPGVKKISIDRYLRTHVGRHNMEKKFWKVLSMIENNGYEFVTFDKLRRESFSVRSWNVLS